MPALPTDRPSVSTLQASHEERSRNASHRTDRHEDECFLCGRGLTQSALDKGWAVWLGTDGALLPVAATDVDYTLDQGWFPVGSECAKRVPLAYRMRGTQAQAV